jgi:glycosyltransferase involved in cell wall biosynthesis
MTRLTARIIHIITHPPAYEEYADKPRPGWNWDTLNGSWVGIWGYDWADILSIELTKINGKIKHEIWQPDLRADCIYSQEIFPGVIHRLFPAKEMQRWIGLKKHTEIYSTEIIQFFNMSNTDGVIIHIGQSVTNKINKNLLEFSTHAKFVFSFHGQITLPIVSLLKLQKNFFAKIHYIREHFIAKKLFKRISFLTYQSNKNLSSLKYYYKGPLAKITMGINCSKYQGYNKSHCRHELNLPLNSRVFLTVCRLYDLKQVDRIIEVLTLIEKDFLYIVVGHGTRKYEEYLKLKAKKLLVQNKIIFAGYKTGEELVKYFTSADLFIHVSRAEAGPVVIMEAMACGLPIFSTETGNTAEVLKENNAGILVGITDYNEWKNNIQGFLLDKSIKVLDNEFVKGHYDWKNVAGKFYKIYECLINEPKE